MARRKRGQDGRLAAVVAAIHEFEGQHADHEVLSSQEAQAKKFLAMLDAARPEDPPADDEPEAEV